MSLPRAMGSQPLKTRARACSIIQANGQACALLSRARAVAVLVTVEGSPEGSDQIIWVMRPSKPTGVAAIVETSYRNDRLRKRPNTVGAVLDLAITEDE